MRMLKVDWVVIINPPCHHLFIYFLYKSYLPNFSPLSLGPLTMSLQLRDVVVQIYYNFYNV